MSIRGLFGESHNRGIVERLTKEVTILDAEQPKSHSPLPARRSFSGRAGEDDA